MIETNVFIEFKDTPEHRGLSVLIEPKRVGESSIFEQVRWQFFNVIFRCANARITEQMAAHHSRNSTVIEAVGESIASVRERLHASGLGQKLTASFIVDDGAYFLIRPAEEPDCIETRAWQTLRRALDLGTDFINELEFNRTFEEDAAALETLLTTELAKLPIFPPGLNDETPQSR